MAQWTFFVTPSDLTKGKKASTSPSASLKIIIYLLVHSWNGAINKQTMLGAMVTLTIRNERYEMEKKPKL